MSKENILRITLFVSVLAFNPAVAQTLKPHTDIQKQQETRVLISIADILHKRGLDADAAEALSQNFIPKDEELFTRMMKNLLNGCKSITEDGLLAYLSNEALFRKSVKLESYDQLVGIVSKIQNKSLDPLTLKALQAVAKKNTHLLA